MSNRRADDTFPRCPNCDPRGVCMYAGPCMACTFARAKWLKDTRPAPPKVNRTLGMSGEWWYYVGAFVDNVKRYPHVNNWIEVVW